MLCLFNYAPAPASAQSLLRTRLAHLAFPDRRINLSASDVARHEPGLSDRLRGLRYQKRSILSNELSRHHYRKVCIKISWLRTVRFHFIDCPHLEHDCTNVTDKVRHRRTDVSESKRTMIKWKKDRPDVRDSWRSFLACPTISQFNSSP